MSRLNTRNCSRVIALSPTWAIIGSGSGTAADSCFSSAQWVPTNKSAAGTSPILPVLFTTVEIGAIFR